VIAAIDRSTSASVVVAFDTEIRMNRRPCQVVPPAQRAAAVDQFRDPVAAQFTQPGPRGETAGAA
jgi:hypothetical protein